MSETKTSIIREILAQAYGEDLLYMDGHDEDIVGVINRCGQEPFVVYDREKVLNTLMATSDMSYDEAIEYMEFNQLGAWVGPNTPGILEFSEIDEDDK